MLIQPRWSALSGGPVIVFITVVADAIVASALIARWANERDHAEATRGRGAQSSLLARAALRALLARHTGRYDWEMRRTQSGKPFLVGPSGDVGPSVSLSHTGATAAVAVAVSGALGVDIERHRARDFAALAARAFGPTEQAEVAGFDADAFYRIWTLREAVAKATGEGLALAANGRDLVAGVATGSCRRIEIDGRVWHLVHQRVAPDCSLAVAHAEASETPWALRWSDVGSIV